MKDDSYYGSNHHVCFLLKVVVGIERVVLFLRQLGCANLSRGEAQSASLRAHLCSRLKFCAANNGVLEMNTATVFMNLE